MSESSNDWFFAMFNPFDAWYQDPSNTVLAEEAVKYLVNLGMTQAAASVCARSSAFGPEGTHKMIDDSYLRHGEVFVPCACGLLWPSVESLQDHVRSEYEKSRKE